jgi:glycosyltransferase involved in cell wall biosynthesis
VIAYVGRLSYQDKADFDALFEAAARLTARSPGFRLVLAGADLQRQSGVLRSRAASFGISNIVEVLPNISEIDKHVLLSGCDIFVSPSNTTSESFGLTLIEAMLHQCPIVCTSWSGYKEIVRDGIDGLLIRTWWREDEESELRFVIHEQEMLSSQVAIDIHQLTHALEYLLLHPEQRHSMGLAGRKRAQHFQIDTTVSAIVELLTELQETFAYRPLPERQLAFANMLGSYADQHWPSDMVLQEAQEADPQRALRTGAPHDLIALKQNCLNHLRPLHTEERFRLLRRGLARQETAREAGE